MNDLCKTASKGSVFFDFVVNLVQWMVLSRPNETVLVLLPGQSGVYTPMCIFIGRPQLLTHAGSSKVPLCDVTVSICVIALKWTSDL